jgi:hypothetical protein
MAYHVCHPGELAALYHSLGGIGHDADVAFHAALEAKVVLYLSIAVWFRREVLGIRAKQKYHQHHTRAAARLRALALESEGADTGTGGSTTGTGGNRSGGSTANLKPDMGFSETDGSTTGTDGSTIATELTEDLPEVTDPEPDVGTAEVSICHRCQEALIKIPIRGARYNALWHDLAQPLDLPLRPPRRRR